MHGLDSLCQVFPGIGRLLHWVTVWRDGGLEQLRLQGEAETMVGHNRLDNHWLHTVGAI